MDELQRREVISPRGQPQCVYWQKRSLLTAPRCVLHQMIHSLRGQTTRHLSCNIIGAHALIQIKKLETVKKKSDLAIIVRRGKIQLADFSGGQIVYLGFL